MSYLPANKFTICHVAKRQPAFKDRLKEALRKRLTPNTGLHPDQLAGYLGRHGGSIRYWLRGSGSASAEAIDELVAFFAHQGDREFFLELYPWVAEQMARDQEAQAIGAAIIKVVREQMVVA